MFLFCGRFLRIIVLARIPNTAPLIGDRPARPGLGGGKRSSPTRPWTFPRPTGTAMALSNVFLLLRGASCFMRRQRMFDTYFRALRPRAAYSEPSYNEFAGKGVLRTRQNAL